MSLENPLALAKTHIDLEEIILLPSAGSGCPFMGLETDGSIMLSEPSPSHRCYAIDNARTPRLDFQARYCLSRDHVQCATFQAAANRLPAHLAEPTAWRPVKKKRRHTGRWLMVSMMSILVLLLGAFAFVERPWEQGGLLTPALHALGLAPISEVALAQAGVATQSDLTAETTASAATDEQATAAADAAAGDNSTVALNAAALEETAKADALAAEAALNNGAAAVAVATDTPTSAPSATPTPSASPGATAIAVISTPTASPALALAANAVVQPNVQTSAATTTTLTLSPNIDEVGWWREGDEGEFAVGDSYLNVGKLNNQSMISAIRISLRDIPRGAPILSGSLTLTGLKGDRLNIADPSSWLVELISERELSALSGATFMMVFSAPNSVTLPVLRPTELKSDGANRLELDANALRWLEQQRIADAESMTVRIVAQVDGPTDTLFAWDSGYGPKSEGHKPVLTVQLGAAPPTPPPVPTEDMVVATFTPAPQNVVTLVAQQATATFVAQSIGTYTPAPIFATPTPFARSLPTVEAIARQLGLPAVVLETPVPANEATMTAVAEYATAVAVTTGTYTPVPDVYVTPMLLVPPLPPARPEDEESALMLAFSGTAVPYNAVIAEWLPATPTPQNVATAAAMSVQATADAAQYGPATATPWGQLAYTPVPPPEPTATPTTPLVQQVTSFTPTPELIPTPTPPASLPNDMRNIILFQSDRFGLGASDKATTLSYNPATEEVARINADWAMPMAREQLAVSPNGEQVAIVKRDPNNLLQIFIRSNVYGSEKQLTTFASHGDGTRSYDPAWSPNGDWIAFVSTNSGNDEIYRITPDGALVEQLTNNTWEWDKHPTWSPDGSQIVFYSNRDTSRKQLWIMNADGSNQKLLLESEGNDWDPVWTR